MRIWSAISVLCLTIFVASCQQNTNDTGSPVAADSSAVQKEEQQEPSEENAAAPKDLQLSYAQRQGRLLYEHYCAVCHGTEGKGDGFNAYNLDPRPKDLTDNKYMGGVSDAWLVEVITQGGRGVKRSVLMPSYEKTLSRKQIKEIVSYLRWLGAK